MRPPSISILTIRDQKVVLDADLARIYGVSTKRLNEQFRRNRKRFPGDFVFQLSATAEVGTGNTGRGRLLGMVRYRWRTYSEAIVPLL